MKKNKYWMQFSFLCCLLCLLLVSCSKNGDEKDAPFLQVLKTETKIDYKGGIVVLQTNMEGVEAHCRDSWLTPEVSGSTVRLVVSPNPDYESRTTTVVIAYNGQEQRIPITQLGVISIVDIDSYDFPQDGGIKAYLWKTDQKYQITGLDPSWLSYEVKGDSIYFKSLALGLYDNTRSCTVDVTVGTYYSKITFTQVAPALPYELILGEYTLEYTRWSGTGIRTTDVELLEKEAGRTLTLRGACAFDITVLFDAERPGISIKSQSLQNFNGEEIWLSAFEGQGGGNLWPDSRFGVMGQWNGDKRNIEFTMVPDGVVDDRWKDKEGNHVITRGFILWGRQEYNGGGETRLVNMKLTKK